MIPADAPQPGDDAVSPGSAADAQLVGDADRADASLADGLARLRQGIILAFIVLLGIGIASITLALMSRSEVVALKEQVAALQAEASAAAVASPQQGAEPMPDASASAQPGIAGPTSMQGPAPTGADEFGALLIGNRSGSSVVEVFVDFQCPYCQRWDKEIGDMLIARALEEGSDLLIKVNPLAFLGETTTDLSVPGASARAANAAACIAEYEDAAVLARYIGAVYAVADPSEPPGQFPPSQLVSIAGEAGARTQATECIRTGDFIPYVAEVTRNSFIRGVGGTPTVVLNGALVDDPFRSQELRRLAAISAS